jgi:hypothetical protein
VFFYIYAETIILRCEIIYLFYLFIIKKNPDISCLPSHSKILESFWINQRKELHLDILLGYKTGMLTSCKSMASFQFEAVIPFSFPECQSLKFIISSDLNHFTMAIKNVERGSHCKAPFF